MKKKKEKNSKPPNYFSEGFLFFLTGVFYFRIFPFPL